MSYLLDKKIKRRKFYTIAVCIFVLFAFFYFRSEIFNGLSHASHKIFRPVLVSGNSMGGKFNSFFSHFASKKSLFLENENLKSQIREDAANRANYDSVVRENIELKNILGRKVEQTNMVLAAILAKPNQSLYDTIVLDIGKNQGINAGSRVFAKGNIPIGRVAEVYPNSSKVILFSNSGEKTQVIISLGHSTTGEAGKPEIPREDGNIFLELVGRGGGSFEMTLPRDFVLLKGDQAVLPGIMPYVVGIVETIVSDPRDSFQKALLVSPVNIQNIKFVEVEA